MSFMSDVIEAGEEFREIAKRYIRTPSGTYRPPVDEKPNFQSFPTLKEDFCKNSSIEHFSDKEILYISQRLAEKNFHQFNYVAHGNLSRVYESNDLAVRVTQHPTEDDDYMLRMAVRANCPLTLQASDYYQTPEYIRVEILPYVVMVNKFRIPEVYKEVVYGVLSGTHFKLDTCKDVGVLPDGTPVFVDTDPIEFTGNKENIEADIATIAENTRKLGLPEPFSWVLPDGRFKQTQFFAPRGEGTLIPAL